VYQTIPPELLHPEMFIPAATLLGLLLGSFYPSFFRLPIARIANSASASGN